jgi:hypothetical protein
MIRQSSRWPLQRAGPDNIFIPGKEGMLGAFGLRLMDLLTLVSPMSMPSLRSSPWMRGAPQSGFFAVHPGDKLACFGRHAEATATTTPGFPRPEEAESLSVLL